MEKGLVNTLGDIFLVLKNILVKEPNKIGPFSKAYYDYFLSIQIGEGERLDEAIERSPAFQKWKEKFLFEDREHKQWSKDDLINRFLDEVHLTSYDIQKLVDGKKIFKEDDPSLKDKPGNGADQEERILRMAADYRGVDLEDILKRMEEIARQQMDEHSGGSHWIGRNGISPYGHGGAAKGGVRVGGAGGGKMARKVIDDPRFFPVDMDAKIKDDNMDAALAALKGVIEESAQQKLDVESTIKKGLKRGGLFLPEMKDVIFEKMQIILLIDNGGYSMDPHIKPVMELFKKMKTRFAHDMEVYYFHNTIYDRVFSDVQRRQAGPIDRFIAHDKNYNVFIIGDAAMAPYELTRLSINNWIRIKEKFPKTAWLNPDRVHTWGYTETTIYLSQIFSMFPLTPRGIEQAILAMNKKNNKLKH